MAIAALLTFIVTGIGTFFLAWQVKLTREAVKDTGEAAEAMNEANRIAQNASRAWLTLDLAHGFFDVRRDSNDAMFFADLTVANIGKSPAGKITVHTCPVPDVMRNEIDDLRAISENLDGKFDSLTSFILLPGDKQTEQIIFSAPIDTFGWGKGTRPDILVVANYKLESGVIAQNSARFVFLEEGRSAVYCGEGFVQEAPLKVERLYNVRVT
jgi:hypothetical protein